MLDAPPQEKWKLWILEKASSPILTQIIFFPFSFSYLLPTWGHPCPNWTPLPNL